MGEKMSEEPVRRKKVRYLSEADLLSLRKQLTKIDFAKSNGKPVAIGRQPWDSGDGHRIMCLLCGIQLTSLGSRGRAHYNHLGSGGGAYFAPSIHPAAYFSNELGASLISQNIFPGCA